MKWLDDAAPNWVAAPADPPIVVDDDSLTESMPPGEVVRDRVNSDAYVYVDELVEAKV